MDTLLKNFIVNKIRGVGTVLNVPDDISAFKRARFIKQRLYSMKPKQDQAIKYGLLHDAV